MESHSPADGQKLSRYRSVRQANATAEQQQQQPTRADSNATGSRSRYHHTSARPTTAHRTESQDATSPLSQTRSPEVHELDQLQSSLPMRRSSTRDNASRDPDLTYVNMLSRRDDGELVVVKSAAEEERLQKLREQYNTPVPRSETHARMVRFNNQAPLVIQARKERELGPEDEVIETGYEPGGGCFAGLFRKRKIDPIKNPAEQIARPKEPIRKGDEPPTMKPGGGGVVQGNNAPVSAVNSGDRVSIDCQTSRGNPFSNISQRILVEYNNSSMLLPVTLETTAMDLINSAANVFSENIDVRASVLLEHYKKVGVQRPLRRYEHIRDVMNSWDDDRSNSLLLIPTRAAEVNPSGLSASNVPQDRPSECSFIMHYSQKPGNWDKRLITIRRDGHIVMSEATKEKDTKEPTNICHLTDFDIYTPTAMQIARKIKPPKKFCYAVKSQVKASMFLSNSTYVHFFCAGDKTLGSSFYDAVQGWRSWHLVHMMGEGMKKRKETGVHRSSSKAGQTVNHQHQHTNTSSIGSNYQLGSFKPLTVDMSQFDRPTSSGSSPGQQTTNQMPIRRPSTRDRAHPPSSFPRHMNLPAGTPQQLSDNEPLVNLAGNRRPSLEQQNSDDAFSAGGLLGRTYSTRRREQQDRDDAAKNPIIGGLINGAGETGIARQVSIKRAGSTRVGGATNVPARRPSTREGGAPRRTGSIDLGRSGSTRVAGKPGLGKPLIDLTPQYEPPPQHGKKGKGRGYKPTPEEIGPGGALIEAATGRDKSWRDEIPEATDWRGRGNAAAGVTIADTNQGRTRSRSRSARDRAAIQRYGEQQGRYASPAGVDDPAFTGGGYLGQQAGAGAARGGRNFTNDSSNSGNSSAGGPLLDVSDASNFKQGSLLAKVERETRGRN